MVEDSRVPDVTDWTDVGIAKYIAASTDEHEEIRETEISEHETTPDNGPADPVHVSQAPHPTPDKEAEFKRAIKEGKIKPMTTQEAIAFMGWYDLEAEMSSDEAKAARLKEYERLSALARKASKAAAKQEGEV